MEGPGGNVTQFVKAYPTEQLGGPYLGKIQKNRIKRLESGQLEFRLSFKTMHDISTQSIAKIMDEHPEFTSIEL